MRRLQPIERRRFLLVALWFSLVALTVTADDKLPRVADASADPKKPPTGSPDSLRTWIDPATGHRVVNLSHGLGASSGFYFHQWPFFDARNMLFKSVTPTGSVLFRVEVPDGTPVQLTEQNTSYYEVIGVRRHEVYYFSKQAPNRGALYGMNLQTRVHRLITDQLPFDELYGVNLTINADETLLGTAYAERIGEHFHRYTRAQRWGAFERLGLTNHLLVVNIDGGQIHDIYRTNAWLGHVQFAPRDPHLIEFCREISAEADPVKDRMWGIRSDGSGLKRIFPQVLRRDIVTHEFWDLKKPVVWFDLRTPAPPDRRLYVASVDVSSGVTQRFEIPEESHSIHYNINADGSMFCGDGGYRYPDKKQQQSIWVFHRKGDHLEPERIFDMNKHNYTRTEPNVHFDPSGQWVIFTYNGEGGRNQVYAVEVKSAARPATP